MLLAIVAAPLMAQQSPARPNLDSLRAASAARVEALRADQMARAEDLRAAQAARAGQVYELRAAKSDIDMATSARAMAIAAPSVSFNVRPVIADFGQGFGSGVGSGYSSSYGPTAPQAWAPQDPADSLYRQAQQAMSRGDYRRAASLFKDLPVKQPNSVYASDALYWEAFSLYRIGGTTELQEALVALDLRKNKYPANRYPAGRLHSDADPALATRIAGVLSARGQGDRDLVKRALTEGSGTCDTEDQSVRAEALNALRQTDPDEALSQARKILGRKDDCSVQLRRRALWMVATKKDAAATTTLVSVAKTDPSMDLRSEATGFLGSMSGDEALAALEELVKSDDERVQRAAIRALTTHPSPRARAAMRSLIENNGTSEQDRITALDAFSSDRSTLDDASWLRSIYPKIESARIKARIVSAVSRIGGEQNEQWMMALAKNEDESIEVRQSALHFVARTADIASLNKFYDGVSARPLREEIVSALGDRKEPEAADKLIEIARSGTDPQVRRSSINSLTRRAAKDPRTNRLLLDLISGDSQSKKP
jgi:HEAT repeat protein/TolA-binding protein